MVRQKPFSKKYRTRVMKNDIEVVSAIAGGAGAVLKGLKAKQKRKALVINLFVGAFLGFGVVQSLVFWFSSKEFAIGLIVFISWIGGWLSNDITDKIENYLDVVYDIIVEKTKAFFDSIGKWFKPKKK